MDTYEAIQMRRSVRTYLPDPVPDETLKKVLEAGAMAPSAKNLMPWYAVVVTDGPKRKAIAAGGTYGKFLADCPVAIVGCADRERSPKWCVVDAAIALQNMVIAATNEGLGTCWVGSFDETAVKTLLKIPDGFGVVAIIALGYPRSGFDPAQLANRVLRPSKKLSQLAGLDEFGKPFP